MLEILPLALGSALYPTLLAMVVLILRRDDPRRLLAAYLAGALVTSLAVGAIVIGALNAGKVVGGSDHTVGPGVDIAGGLLALLLFYVLRTDRDRALRERRLRRKAAKDDKTPLSQRVLERESLIMTFMIGVALSLPGMLYLVALKDIAATNQSTGADVAQLLVYNVIMFQWAEIPLIGYAISPDGTRAVVLRMNAWLGSHTRQIAMALCGATGAYLLTRGLIAAIP